MPFNAALAASPDKRSGQQRCHCGHFVKRAIKEFWIGTHYAGLNRYDAATGHYIKYRNENTPTSLANNIVWSCYEDRQGRFGSAPPTVLSIMDRQAETFKTYKPQENNPHSLRAASVEDIYEDGKGRLWFTTSSGLHVFVPRGHGRF